MEYQKLQDSLIIETLERLEVRIAERFPNAGLRKVAAELLEVARETSHNIEWINRPLWALRAFTYAVIAVGVVTIVYGLSVVKFEIGASKVADVLTLMEATLNDLVMLGAAIFFLLTLENRVKRSRALKKLNDLRTIAHVVDMHQLTKDPTAREKKLNTEHSPKRNLSDHEMERYLDYCSELLSMISKMAALYSQSLPDDVVVSAASDIESMSTELSQKIWQKLMILNHVMSGKGE